MEIIKIENDKKWKEIYRVYIKTNRIYIINTIIQTMTSYIRTYSFGKINIKKNTSSIKNEQLSQIIRIMKLNQSLVEKNTTIEYDSKKYVNTSYMPIFMKDFWKDDMKKIPYIPNIYLLTLRKDEELVFKATIDKSYAKKDNAYTAVGDVGHRFISDDIAMITINLLEVYDIKNIIKLTFEKILEHIQTFKKHLDKVKSNDKGRYIFKLDTEDKEGISTLLGPLKEELSLMDVKNEYFISYDQNHPQIEEYDFYYNGNRKDIDKALLSIEKYVKNPL